MMCINIQKMVQRLSHDELLELALNLIQSDKRVQERALDFFRMQRVLDCQRNGTKT
ncbi:hypothetical protein HNQ34_003137 [Anoxybacillus tepidamans]|uniref:Uncharacterized protein n=1 Tax=Anoxybacteroides tepidamans TaxID=265948 RepID=A0A7W8IUP5_9BACL|nr:hypothetical protein [Anoxybacillus tepidamans]MBB5326019.1 hypothetical protein [Anoxybacillus tepidamans]